MKKSWLAGFALTAGLACTAFMGEEVSAKVIWDGAEISAGQTGKLAFNKDTKIYKKNADGTFTSMVSKKGSFWRVYGQQTSVTGTIYNMSGGYRVQASPLTTYKQVPTYIQDQVKMTVTKRTQLVEELDKVWASIYYVELNGLSNSTLERQINQYLKSVAMQAQTDYLQLKKEREMEIRAYQGWNRVSYEEANEIVPSRSLFLDMSLDYNSKGYITIGIKEDSYGGGAHGYGYYRAVSYNLATAKQVTLNDFIKTPAQRAKFNQYVLQRMINANKSIPSSYLVDEYAGVNAETPFYLRDEGIVLVYNPYELGSYASGIRELYVPFSGFQ